jgi:hypothetical protein
MEWAEEGLERALCAHTDSAFIGASWAAGTGRGHGRLGVGDSLNTEGQRKVKLSVLKGARVPAMACCCCEGTHGPHIPHSLWVIFLASTLQV